MAMFTMAAEFFFASESVRFFYVESQIFIALRAPDQILQHFEKTKKQKRPDQKTTV